MRTQPRPPNSAQLPLLAPDPPTGPQPAEQAVQGRARALFHGSPLLAERWSSFEAAMADPVMGKALRVAAAALLRSAARRHGTRGRQR